MSAVPKFEDAALIAAGYVETKCGTTNCYNTVWIPPWFVHHGKYCDTCRPMVTDDFRELDFERDTNEEEDNET